MNYREALAWLYATQQFGIKLGLENTDRLLNALGFQNASAPGSARGSRADFGGLPKSFPRVIHVAGTNGKGSVCAFADAICRAAGYRSGLFTSPHLISFRERIRVNGETISEGAVARGLTAISEAIHDWDPHPTFFEITTALGLLHFRNRRCDIIVLETGMGGRLDATNAVASDVSVITSIDFDHEKWLGHSLSQIATEKAGIIKAQVPVISALQPQEASEVIRQRARECASPLQFVTTPWTKTKVSLPGSHQRLNAALAVEAIREIDRGISDESIVCGLSSVDWPARFQIWNDRIIIDGAHNRAGAQTLATTWQSEFGDERATIVLAVLRDKDCAAIVAALAPMAARFVLPQIHSQRAVPPHELAEVLASISPSLPCFIGPSLPDALASAAQYPERILITGSLHFAGEALAHLRGQAESLEECAQ